MPLISGKKEQSMKIIAELTQWDGKKKSYEIEREWIDDIVCAVQGQYTYINNKAGFTIKGSDFAHINVYEVKDDSEL